MMHNVFQMSMMGKLWYFIRLKIHQSMEGPFINQEKYYKEILKRFGMDKENQIYFL